MSAERTIRTLVETLTVEGVLENDKLREAISVVIQELHKMVEEKRKNQIIYPEEKCPCGECD
jgi:hypothetical protein